MDLSILQSHNNFSSQDNDDCTALLAAVKFRQRNKDPSKKEDFREIVRSLVKHPKVDLNKKKSGKNAYEMAKPRDKHLAQIIKDESV